VAEVDGLDGAALVTELNAEGLGEGDRGPGKGRDDEQNRERSLHGRSAN
jgi:hypothetical protein